LEFCKSLGRFEIYAEAYANVWTTLGVGEAAPVLRHLNKSRRENLCLSDYYDATLQDLVYRRYRADFDAFGYAPGLPL
jgi:hypothetical protein